MPASGSESEMVACRLFVGCIAASCVGAALAGGDGLTISPGAFESPRWQARFEIDQPIPLVSGMAANWALGSAPLTGRLFGEYRIENLRFGLGGGLSLTSGVLLNLLYPGTAGLGVAPGFGINNASTARPYAGIGYSGTTAHGDWGFSAEFGLAAQNPGAAGQFGRMFNGVSFGDTVRDLQLQPMIRLGMNYAF